MTGSPFSADHHVAQPAQTPDDAPKLTTYRYPNKVALVWDDVPGASSYDVFRTPGVDTNFGPNPEPLTMVRERVGWVPVAEGEDPAWYGPLVDEIPWMRHPMVVSS